MKLRWLAIIVWIGAACFTTMFAAQLVSSDLRELISDRGAITVKVKLLSEPTEEAKQLGQSKRFRAQVEILEPIKIAGSKGKLSGDSRLANLHEGDSFTGSISFRPAFGFASDFTASLRSLGSIQPGSGPNPIGYMRKTFLANLTGVTPDSAALVAGLAIGDDSKLSESTKDNFKIVSLTHLSAVSGANCAIVLAGFALLLGLLPIARRLRIGLSFGVIGIYLALVGQEASVLRASVMVGAVLFGMALGRRVAPLDALSLSIVLLLTYRPALSMDYGFALSVLATFGLLVMAPRLTELFGRKLPEWLALLVAVSLAAQLACLPVLLILQPKIPVYSIFANILAEPLVAPITVLGLIACLFAPVVPLVSTCLSMLASYPAALIVWIGNSLAQAPAASLNWYSGFGGVILGVILTASCWAMLSNQKRWLKVLAGVSAAVIVLSFGTQSSIALLQTGHFYQGNYTLVNCDVGQGDALVIKSKGKVALIDVGREDPAIDSCLSNMGISHINLLVLTHFDMDHIGGVVGAVSGRTVDQALLTSYNDTRPGADFATSYLTGLGIDIARAEVGMKGQLGEFSWLVLSPHRGGLEAEDSNDGSITMLWQDQLMAVFTLADLGERGQLRVGAEQSALLSSGFGGRIVVVKVAHHGSADQAAEFYETIAPTLSIISVGQGNSYGHPTERTLKMLELVNTKIVRTDRSGAVGVAETDAGLTVSVSGRS